MRQLIIRVSLIGLIGFLVLGGPAAQDTEADPPRATGLIPLDAAEIEWVVSNWPRVTKVGLNRLGYERVNEVRARKGKPALDPGIVEPIGLDVMGLRTPPGVTVQTVSGSDLLAGDLPVSVDNSQLRFFPPIRSQGSVGSCVSFAATYYQLSYMTAFERNLDIRDPSDNTNKYSPKWSYNMVNGGSDDGSSFGQNYSLLEKHGAATWAEFPYDSNFRAWCLDPAAWRNALGVRPKVTQYVYDVDTALGLDLVKELLTDGYIVVFGTYISSWVFTTIPDDPSTADDDFAVGRPVAFWLNGSEGSHAMTIVGYNDAVWTDVNANGTVDPGEKGALRIANSWGTSWREGGFTWLAYDALRATSAVSGGPWTGRSAAFQNDMVFVLTPRNGYAPLMIGEFTIEHVKRNQLRLSLGTSNTTTATPTVTWTPTAVTNDGGAYAFDGTTTAVTGSFALDFTDILVAGAGPQRYYLGLYDNTLSDPVTLSAFKIVDLTTDPDTQVASSLVPQTIDSQQGYAYVDYAYLGPAYNDPPQLTSAQVSPVTGRGGDTYTFTVRYIDPDGDVPAVKNVLIDGVAHEMSLIPGQQPASGWYSYETLLPIGAHVFSCHFEDGRGESARAPIAGDIDGPTVYGHILTSLSPASAGTGDSGFTLIANGSLFDVGSVVTWDGADRPSTFVSESRLEAEIDGVDLALGKTVPVVVRDSSGQLSNVLQFSVNNPHPSLTSVSPTTATGGGSGVTLTLTGSDFVSNSVVRWNGIDLATTYQSSTEVRVPLSAQNLASSGEFEVAVVNPAPAGGVTSALTFFISDFTLNAADPNLAATAGQSANCAVEVSPRYGSFDASVSFSCLGLPRGCSATFSPETVTPGDSAATTTLTLKTTSRQSLAGAMATAPGGLAPPVLGLILLAVAIVFPALLCRMPLAGPARRRLAAAALVLLVVGLAGCGASGTNGSSDAGTPAGTYTITIQGASGGLTAQTSITLVVN
jgi:C1A family cysteine protease